MSTSWTLIRQRKNLNLKISLPTAIYALAIFLIIFNPQFLNADAYQLEIKYRGCYEGTMNTGTFFFRKRGKFEYRHVGFFGMTTFINGTWSQKGDTINISYRGELSEFMGTQLLMTNERFIKIEVDSLQKNEWGFYRGYCKGLN